jgi:hypothetical protein
LGFGASFFTCGVLTKDGGGLLRENPIGTAQYEFQDNFDYRVFSLNYPYFVVVLGR